MKTDVETLTLSETTAMLRTRLGPLRSWYSFLTDCLRYRADIAGHRLFPCASQQERGCFRPVYSLTAVLEFISKVLADEPRAGRTPIRTKTLHMDVARGWRANKFDALGSPVAMFRAAP